MTSQSAISESGVQDLNDAPVVVGQTVQQNIRNALVLLDHAITSGFKTADGQTLPQDVVAIIKAVAAKAGVTDTRRDGKAEAPPSGVAIQASEWATFDQAHYRLAALMHPVTAQTLRDTEDAGRWFSLSPALNFNKLLWVITLGFAAFVIGSDFGLQRYGPVLDGEVDRANTIMQLVQLLIPFAYGGLGSCVYLLRSAHTYIHERTFDIRRTPEYFNRIVLGTISGGAIILFVSEIATDDGGVVQLSSAALGFLAGYSTDFLFNTIERVIGAILPKVGIRSVRQNTPATRPALEILSGGTTLKDLVERYEQAQGADKDLYKSLIDKLRDRL
jgi:hypothetical protein